MEDRAEGRSFTLLPNSLMICLARLILDLLDAFDSVNHKVLVTRLWSTAGMGCTPFEVSGEFIPGRRVPVGSHRELLMIHVYLLGGLSPCPIYPAWAEDSGTHLWKQHLLDGTHLVIIFSTDQFKTILSFDLAHGYFGLGRK